MENWEEKIANQKPTLLEFYADWCGPCQTMEPIIEDIQKEFEHTVNLLKIDVDLQQELTERFKIRSVPTLILFKEKEIVWKAAGLQSRATIRKAIKNNIE